MRVELLQATNSYTIERSRGKITNFAISPSEDTLLCSTDTNQVAILDNTIPPRSLSWITS